MRRSIHVQPSTTGNLVFLGFDQNNCSLNSFTSTFHSNIPIFRKTRSTYRTIRLHFVFCHSNRYINTCTIIALKTYWLTDWQTSCQNQTVSRARERCWKPAQPGRGRSSVLKSCWAGSSREHGCSAPTSDRDWSVHCWIMGYHGIHCRTLSCEEWCGRMLANPVKSTCTSTTPQL